jgi:hypothetical protein
MNILEVIGGLALAYVIAYGLWALRRILRL